jgi:hypothetical protein
VDYFAPHRANSPPWQDTAPVREEGFGVERLDRHAESLAAAQKRVEGRFNFAYQRVQPLTIGEPWAVAITLRIVLVENLRRLADQIIAGQAARANADALANRLLVSGEAPVRDISRPIGLA